MTKANKYKLPDNFYRIMERGDPEKIKAVFQDEDLSVHLRESKDPNDNPLFKYSPCTEIYKWFAEQGFDIAMESRSGQPIHEHARCEKNNIEGIILAGADIEALKLIRSIGRNSKGNDVLRLCEINIHWVLANPEPIPLGSVNYKR